MTRAEAKWAIANPETLKAMADGEEIQVRCGGLEFDGREREWLADLSDDFHVSGTREFRKKPDPAPPKEPKRWLIWSLKHNLWWVEKSLGYTTELKFAGRYTYEEACECVRQSNQHGQDTPSSAMIEDPDQ